MKDSTHTIKTALLSYGMSGFVFHGPLLGMHKGFEITSVLSRSKPIKGNSFSVVSDFQDILRDTSIELIIVNTPNETHFEYACKALKAAKHVVVEKPFTVSSAEARKLIELAKIENRIITIFQNRRWDGDFLTLKEILKSAKLGKIVEFECHYDRFRNVVDHA